MSKNIRITVFSDTHGNTKAIRAALPTINGGDYFVFLGDGYRDLCRVQDEITVPILAVRGNCDLFCPLPPREILSVGQCDFLLTHGYAYGVKQDVSSLAAFAAQNGCAYALFGHTHRAFVGEKYGTVLINPGSASGAGHTASYAVIEGSGVSYGAKIIYL